MKYGLWEDGKRIEWFSEAEMHSINSQKLDYGTYFHQQDSHEMIDRGCTFSRPNGLEDRLTEIKRKVA